MIPPRGEESDDGRFASPAVHEMAGRLEAAVLPGLTIDWDAVVADLPVVDSPR